MRGAIKGRRQWLALALMAAGGAFAQMPARAHDTHATPGGKPMRAGTGASLAASAAFDARGGLWMVGVDGPHVVLRHSGDAGKSWHALGKVNATPEPIGAEGDARPKLALGTNNEIYVTWTKPLSKPFTGDIRFARSLDGGKSFSAPVTVHTDRQEITHRFDAITVTKDGSLFLAWIDKRDQVKQGNSYRGAAVYYTVSSDRGATFRGDFKAADHSCECCRIALLPRDDGSVLALWRQVFEPNVRDHALVSLNADGRAGTLRRATYDEWAVDICPHHGPSLAADGSGRLHAVWFTQGAKRSGIFYGRLTEGAAGGAVDGLRQVGGEAAAHADLAADAERVVIAWTEFDGTRTRLRALLSEDAGNTWRERDLAATADASDHARVLTHGGRFYVFWNTRREGARIVPITP